MPKDIDREELRRMVEASAQLVEVPKAIPAAVVEASSGPT